MCFVLTWPSRVVLCFACERSGLLDLLKPKVGRDGIKKRGVA